MSKVILAVCLVRNSWKLFSDGEAAQTFLEREEAVFAANSAARASAALGHDVHLYLEDLDGHYKGVTTGSSRP